MHLICSYCGKYIKEKKPYEVIRTTHGICSECYLPLIKQLEDLSYDSYLETFNVPVLLVDSNLIIASANKAILALVGKKIDNVRGKLGGEAVDCLYSGLVQGCGKTDHCETCQIRNLVVRTGKTRMAHCKFRISFETAQGKKNFFVSTSSIDDLILIAFEKD